jgi:hypothetical protein
MITLSVTDFFKYHANRGGRSISIWLDGQFKELTLGQFANLTTFELASDNKLYLIKNGQITY